MLGEPWPVCTDVRISFRGEGQARFQLLHGAGEKPPADGYWAFVSDLARVKRDVKAGDEADEFLDIVNGDTEMVYYRVNADWIRVVPRDDTDPEAVRRCKAYEISVEPA